jgi:L-lactate dehydrogenase complex protein LldF
MSTPSLETKATKRSAHVHWTLDAPEHNPTVYSILHDHGVNEFIKSKSMLWEECQIAPFLQHRGIEVIESDLSEGIQQLDGQPPSRFVFHSIRNPRQDVARLFALTIGTDPSNDDPHFLARAMRNHARPRFLSAGTRMTGCNLAIAEMELFKVCTNEGNADIGASVPTLHIVSIGIENMIPRVEDMGAFLQLLAHVPGGELYVSLGMPEFWHSPECIRCGARMNTCPIFRMAKLAMMSYGRTLGNRTLGQAYELRRTSGLKLSWDSVC